MTNRPTVIEFWPHATQPGVIKYRRAGNRNQPVDTATSAEFARLRAWWVAQYGEPTETSADGKTRLTFAPPEGVRFYLKAPVWVEY